MLNDNNHAEVIVDPDSLYKDTGKFKAIVREVFREVLKEEIALLLKKGKDAVTFFFSQTLKR